MALKEGRLQWTRVPMGTKVSSDIFQQKLDEAYKGLPGVTGITDDMVIYGKTPEEHDRNFLGFLQRTRKKRIEA